jgi:hypothetical protein
MEDTIKHKEFSLSFFSTFEPISLTPDSCMQKKVVPMLYDQSATVLQSVNVTSSAARRRVPLIPCYLNGNTSNTVAYRHRGAIPA